MSRLFGYSTGSASDLIPFMSPQLQQQKKCIVLLLGRSVNGAEEQKLKWGSKRAVLEMVGICLQLTFLNGCELISVGTQMTKKKRNRTATDINAVRTTNG